MDSVIGTVGVVIVATRGAGGLGEVSLRVGGATESFLARSAEPLARGTEIVVVDKHGPRTVEVEPLAGVDEPAGAAVPSDPLLEL